MKKFLSVAIISGMILSAFAMTACSNESENSQSDTEVSASESVQSNFEVSKETVSDISVVEEKAKFTSTQLAQINNVINSYKSVPTFMSQSDEIDAKEISKEVTVTFIPQHSNNSFCSLVSDQFRKGAETAGFKKVIIAETDGTSDSYNKALESSIGTSDIIILFGDINKDLISANIELAQANGIKVISAGNVGKDEKDHYVDYTVPIDYQLSGQLLADWCISKQTAKVNALAINNSDSTLSTSIYKGFSSEFEKYVVSGYCTVLGASSIEVGNGLATKIKEAINKDPNINYVIVLDESMIDDAVSGVEQSGKNISIISTGGMTETFSTAEDNKIEMLVAQSYEWTGYAIADYALRAAGKKTLPKEQNVPFRVVYADSIKRDLKENTYDDIDGFYEICFGSEFLTGYLGLWGI